MVIPEGFNGALHKDNRITRPTAMKAITTLATFAVLAAIFASTPAAANAGDSPVLTVLGTATGNTSLGIKRLDVIKTEFAKHGVTDFRDFVAPTPGDITVTFVKCDLATKTKPLTVETALIDKGYRLATAAEAASFDKIPLLNGSSVTCIGTAHPVDQDQFLTLGFRYQKQETTPEKAGLETLFLLSQYEGWKGTMIIPVIKVEHEKK